ncbi:hypothetical protein O3M35_003901 [Rhynocoris fuscipes]|uniref:Titin n=1 Tax=Rhynocoris fuscipes TaxID=488301 RepID=A0AAW1CND1_9HEMI
MFSNRSRKKKTTSTAKATTKNVKLIGSKIIKKNNDDEIDNEEIDEENLIPSTQVIEKLIQDNENNHQKFIDEESKILQSEAFESKTDTSISKSSKNYKIIAGKIIDIDDDNKNMNIEKSGESKIFYQNINKSIEEGTTIENPTEIKEYIISSDGSKKEISQKSFENVKIIGGKIVKIDNQNTSKELIAGPSEIKEYIISSDGSKREISQKSSNTISENVKMVSGKIVKSEDHQRREFIEGPTEIKEYIISSDGSKREISQRSSSAISENVKMVSGKIVKSEDHQRREFIEGPTEIKEYIISSDGSKREISQRSSNTISENVKMVSGKIVKSEDHQRREFIEGPTEIKEYIISSDGSKREISQRSSSAISENVKMVSGKIVKSEDHQRKEFIEGPTEIKEYIISSDGTRREISQKSISENVKMVSGKIVKSEDHQRKEFIEGPTEIKEYIISSDGSKREISQRSSNTISENVKMVSGKIVKSEDHQRKEFIERPTEIKEYIISSDGTRREISQKSISENVKMVSGKIVKSEDTSEETRKMISHKSDDISGQKFMTDEDIERFQISDTKPSSEISKFITNEQNTMLDSKISETSTSSKSFLERNQSDTQSTTYSKLPVSEITRPVRIVAGKIIKSQYEDNLRTEKQKYDSRYKDEINFSDQDATDKMYHTESEDQFTEKSVKKYDTKNKSQNYQDDIVYQEQRNTDKMYHTESEDQFTEKSVKKYDTINKSQNYQDDIVYQEKRNTDKMYHTESEDQFTEKSVKKYDIINKSQNYQDDIVYQEQGNTDKMYHTESSDQFVEKFMTSDMPIYSKPHSIDVNASRNTTKFTDKRQMIGKKTVKIIKKMVGGKMITTEVIEDNENEKINDDNEMKFDETDKYSSSVMRKIDQRSQINEETVEDRRSHKKIDNTSFIEEERHHTEDARYEQIPKTTEDKTISDRRQITTHITDKKDHKGKVVKTVKKMVGGKIITTEVYEDEDITKKDDYPKRKSTDDSPRQPEDYRTITEVSETSRTTVSDYRKGPKDDQIKPDGSKPGKSYPTAPERKGPKDDQTTPDGKKPERSYPTAPDRKGPKDDQTTPDGRRPQTTYTTDTTEKVITGKTVKTVKKMVGGKIITTEVVEDEIIEKKPKDTEKWPIGERPRQPEDYRTVTEVSETSRTTVSDYRKGPKDDQPDGRRPEKSYPTTPERKGPKDDQTKPDGSKPGKSYPTVPDRKGPKDDQTSPDGRRPQTTYTTDTTEKVITGKTVKTVKKMVGGKIITTEVVEDEIIEKKPKDTEKWPIDERPRQPEDYRTVTEVSETSRTTVSDYRKGPKDDQTTPDGKRPEKSYPTAPEREGPKDDQIKPDGSKPGKSYPTAPDRKGPKDDQTTPDGKKPEKSYPTTPDRKGPKDDQTTPDGRRPQTTYTTDTKEKVITGKTVKTVKKMVGGKIITTEVVEDEIITKRDDYPEKKPKDTEKWPIDERPRQPEDYRTVTEVSETSRTTVSDYRKGPKDDQTTPDGKRPGKSYPTSPERKGPKDDQSTPDGKRPEKSYPTTPERKGPKDDQTTPDGKKPGKSYPTAPDRKGPKDDQTTPDGRRPQTTYTTDTTEKVVTGKTVRTVKKMVGGKIITTEVVEDEIITKRDDYPEKKPKDTEKWPIDERPRQPEDYRTVTEVSETSRTTVSDYRKGPKDDQTTPDGKRPEKSYPTTPDRKGPKDDQTTPDGRRPEKSYTTSPERKGPKDDQTTPDGRRPEKSYPREPKHDTIYTTDTTEKVITGKTVKTVKKMVGGKIITREVVVDEIDDYPEDRKPEDRYPTSPERKQPKDRQTTSDKFIEHEKFYPTTVDKRTPEKGYPDGRKPEKEYPEGRKPEKEYPDGRKPEKEYPDGRKPGKEYPEGRKPEKEYPDGRKPEDKPQKPTDKRPTKDDKTIVPKDSYPQKPKDRTIEETTSTARIVAGKIVKSETRTSRKLTRQGEKTIIRQVIGPDGVVREEVVKERIDYPDIEEGTVNKTGHQVITSETRITKDIVDKQYPDTTELTITEVIDTPKKKPDEPKDKSPKKQTPKEPKKKQPDEPDYIVEFPEPDITTVDSKFIKKTSSIRQDLTTKFDRITKDTTIKDDKTTVVKEQCICEICTCGNMMLKL